MKKLVFMLTIAVVAIGAVATNQWLDLRAEREKAAEIATRLTAAESMRPAQAAATQVPENVMPPAAAVTNPPPVATPVVIAPAPANQQSAARAPESPMKGMLEAMSTPEAQDAMRAMMRREMTRMHPDIEQELGITAQEKQKLFDLLSNQDQDITSMMLAMQDPSAARDMQRKMVEAERAQEAKVSTLLGSKYPKWVEYQSTIDARQEVDQLRRTLSASETPLSEDQSRQLVAAFAAEKRRTRKEDRDWTNSAAALNSPDFMQEGLQREAESQNRLVDAASPILNPAQRDRYKRQVEQEAAMMRVGMEMMTGGGKP